MVLPLHLQVCSRLVLFPHLQTLSFQPVSCPRPYQYPEWMVVHTWEGRALHQRGDVLRCRVRKRASRWNSAGAILPAHIRHISERTGETWRRMCLVINCLPYGWKPWGTTVVRHRVGSPKNLGYATSAVIHPSPNLSQPVPSIHSRHEILFFPHMPLVQTVAGA